METEENRSLIVGDVVMLKSGGPAMTVTGTGDNYGVPSVWVSWFSDSEEKQTTLPIKAVERVKDSRAKK